MLVAAPPAVALTSVGGIDVQTLADALQRNPVQVSGHPDPTLSAAQRRALRARISKVDPGRIWVAVVSPVSVQATGDLDEAVSEELNSDGVVIVVAGSNYHITTTWGSGNAARARLSDAVNRPGDSLAVQLRRAVDSFASADAAAGHPGANSSESGTQTQTQPLFGGGTSTASPSGSGSGSGSGSASGGGSAGLIVGLIALGLVLATVGLFGARYFRRTLRTSHRHKEETADAHEQAQADFTKLGEEIGALDVDSAMPNASAQGKDEYGKSIECYQDAERRLQHSDDNYQFERALDALKRGLEHVHAAEHLFNASEPDPASPTPAPVMTHEPSAPVASASTGLGHDMVDELSKLAALHDRGALTDTEFDREKRKLLGE
jgi:Short C-terminal domain